MLIICIIVAKRQIVAEYDSSLELKSRHFTFEELLSLLGVVLVV